MAKIKFDAKIAKRKLNKALNDLNKLEPLLMKFGVQGVAIINKNIESEQDKKGTRWPELSTKTLALRKKNGRGAKMLQDGGHFKQTINYQLMPKSVRVGTGTNYGGKHHFGVPETNLPKREWAYVNSNGKRKLNWILKDFANKLFGVSKI
jgi:phage gpG-like protein